MHRSLTIIVINHCLPLVLLLFNILEHICPTTFGIQSKPLLKTVKPTIFEVIIFHENTELLPPGDSSDLSPGNNDPTNGITLVLVGVPFGNQLGW